MFRKLLRFIFLEKSARQRLEQREAAGAAGPARKKAARKSARTAAKGSRPAKGAAGGKASKKAAAKAPGVTLPNIPKKGGGRAADPDEVDVAMMVREAVSEAERILDAEKQATEGSGLTAGAGRKELLQAAMAVHRSKQSALNQLDVSSRARLRALAEVMMGGKMGGPKK